jgi:hypothetical protein
VGFSFIYLGIALCERWREKPQILGREKFTESKNGTKKERAISSFAIHRKQRESKRSCLWMRPGPPISLFYMA